MKAKDKKYMTLSGCVYSEQMAKELYGVRFESMVSNSLLVEVK